MPVKVLIDVDALYGWEPRLGLPFCIRDSCERNGESSVIGECQNGSKFWCRNLRRPKSVVATYRDPHYFDRRLPLEFINPALSKLIQCGWSVALWTTRPQNQTIQIIASLEKAGLWDKFQLLAKDLVLHSIEVPPDWDYSIETVKLSLLEKYFREELESGRKFVAIERDPMEAAILKEYAQGRVIVHMSPEVWVNIISVEHRELLSVLLATECPILRPGIDLQENMHGRVSDESGKLFGNNFGGTPVLS